MGLKQHKRQGAPRSNGRGLKQMVSRIRKGGGNFESVDERAADFNMGLFWCLTNREALPRAENALLGHAMGKLRKDLCGPFRSGTADHFHVGTYCISCLEKRNHGNRDFL